METITYECHLFEHLGVHYLSDLTVSNRQRVRRLFEKQTVYLDSVSDVRDVSTDDLPTSGSEHLDTRALVVRLNETDSLTVNIVDTVDGVTTMSARICPVAKMMPTAALLAAYGRTSGVKKQGRLLGERIYLKRATGAAKWLDSDLYYRVSPSDLHHEIVERHRLKELFTPQVAEWLDEMVANM